jgi:hypothetical protein
MLFENLKLQNALIEKINKSKKYICEGFIDGPPMKFILIRKICDITVRTIKLSK